MKFKAASPWPASGYTETSKPVSLVWEPFPFPGNGREQKKTLHYSELPGIGKGRSQWK